MKKLLLLLAIAFCLNLQAQFTKLLDFNGANGSEPRGALFSDGTFLYGMTQIGGANDSGTIFKIKPDGSNYITLLSLNKTTGHFPWGSLISDGTYLYGMTTNGGGNADGTIFKIMPDGSNFTKLLDFNGINGRIPFGDLYYDGTYLYGMTYAGGVNSDGVIFKILPDGTGYTKLFDFSNSSGIKPTASLISDGTFLYGMAVDSTGSSGGLIFKIKPDGTNYSILTSVNGTHPYGSLLLIGNELYGTVTEGGTDNHGTVFKVQKNGTGYTLLHDFGFFGMNSGDTPSGDLIYDGTFLYGMAAGGGVYGDGIAFRIKPDGTGYTNLHNNVTTEGSNLYGSFILQGGLLYGMAQFGGTNNDGTLFSLCPPVVVNTATICVGGTATVTASCANTYTWSTGNTGAVINPTPTVTTSYTVTGTVGTCTSSAVAVVTVINTTPTLTLTSNNDTICKGTSKAISVSGANSYTWMPSVGLSNPDTANQTVAPSTTTIYTVTGTNACGVGTPTTCTITVNPSPTVTISGGGTNSQTICSGGSVAGIIFNATPSGTINWVNSNTSIGLAHANSGNITSFSASTVTVPTTGVITAYATDSITGCVSTNSTALTYTINIMPLPTITVSTSSICLGNTATLTASGANTYTWGVNAGNDTGVTSIIYPSINTTYTVSGSVGACTSSKTFTISPLAILITGDTVIGPNGYSVLTASGASNYIWSSNAGSVTTNTVLVSPVANTTYTVSGMVGSCLCNSSITVLYEQIPVITTVAGNGTLGYTGDGGTATAAELNYAWGVQFDAIGNLYIADSENSVIRKVIESTGTISTVVGNGGAYLGDGPATSACLQQPNSLVFDASGNMYIATTNFIKKVASTGAVITIAGYGNPSQLGYTGDGGAATNARLGIPHGLTFDSYGNLFFADWSNHVIRKIVMSTGIITTVAGNGYNAGTVGGWTGDGGLATAAELSLPDDIAIDASGNIYIADYDNRAIRKVTASTGIITTVAGSITGGTCGGATVAACGDGGAATDARLDNPTGVELDASGNIYIASGNYVSGAIRKIDVSTGIISTLAGLNNCGYCGDGGPAIMAGLGRPAGMAFDACGNLYVAESQNNVIRKIWLGTSNGFNLQPQPTTICSGDSAVFMVQSCLPSSFQWQVNTGSGFSNTSLGVNNKINSSFLTISNTTSSMNGNLYRCIIQDSIKDTSNIVSLTVNPSPTINVLGANSQLVCGGDSVLGITFNVTPSGIVNWVNSDTTIGLGSSNSGNIAGFSASTVTVTTTDIITASTTIQSTGCQSQLVYTITVNPSPIITVNSPSICAVGTSTLTASGANTFTWSTGATLTTITVAPTITTNYTVNGTNSFGCTSKATSTVTVDSIPNLIISALHNTICAGISDTLTASGATTYSWSPTEDLNVSIGAVVIANPATSTTYTITGANGNCFVTDTISIAVKPIPSIPQLTNTNITYCQGPTYPPINASGTGVILWSNNLSMYPVINTGNSYTPTNLPLGTTIYYLADSSGTNGCINPGISFVIVAVVVDSAPSVSTQLVQDAIPHVWDLYVNYSANVINATWYWGDGTDTSSLYPTHSYDTAGTYNICVTVFNACGDSANFCQNDSIYRLAHNGISSNNMVHVNVMQGQTTSINQVTANNNQITVYPNPNDGLFNLTISRFDNEKTNHIEIYNSVGACVHRQIATSSNCQINLSNLAEGVYNLSVISNYGVINKRLVIVR